MHNNYKVFKILRLRVTRSANNTVKPKKTSKLFSFTVKEVQNLTKSQFHIERHIIHCDVFIAVQFSSVQFGSGPWSPQWAEGIWWGASGTKWQRCTAWHSWDTWSSQDHQLVRRIMSSCDWTLPCCQVVRHPDRQNCRCDWHHQPSLLL